MDYSKLSDFEINCSIAEMTGHMPLSEEQGYAGIQESNITAAIVRGPRKIGGFDPCNEPTDAWPIVVENKISLVWIAETSRWCASHGGNAESEYWGWDECPDVHHESINPLRAAMIVFLMMHEPCQSPS
ncbi:TPA: DUF2591 domain-containing protein [Klebsiella oxytoca]|nr:DUF2591 domain-containing protein [Klebsiella oxytoca]